MKRTNIVCIARSLMLVTVFSGFSEAKTVSDISFPLLVTGHVVNMTELSGEILAEAENEAGQIFQAARIQVRWLNCSTPPEFIRNPDPCNTPLGPADLTLRLTKRPVPTEMGLRLNVIGLAANTEQGGVCAFVFCDRIKEMVKETQLPFSRVLSCAMAHEMGHLLMGKRPHSSRGLMREDWDEKDLRSMAMRPMSFFSQESDLMRLNLKRRMTSGTDSKAFATGKVQGKRRGLL
jgi:hypothetical protein